MIKKNPKFLRMGTRRYKKLGKNQRKKQRYRKPRGRDNKIRENIKHHLRKVRIGFKNKKTERGKIKGKVPIMVGNINEAGMIKKGDLVIIRKIGAKKRAEIEKIIKEKEGEVFNVKKLKIKESKTEEKKNGK